MRVVTAVCLAVLVAAVLACCGCAPKPTAPPAASLPDSPVAPATSAPSVTLGEQLYKTGLGENGQHVAFTAGSDRFKAKPGGCLGCHGEDGRGRTLPKGAIPAIHYSALRVGDKPEFPSDDAVIAAFREGKNEKGEALSSTMPRWAFNDAEAAAVIEYLKVLDSAPAAPAEPAAKPTDKPAPANK